MGTQGGGGSITGGASATTTGSGSTHQIVFSYRESRALARIVVTNDPNWQP